MLCSEKLLIMYHWAEKNTLRIPSLLEHFQRLLYSSEIAWKACRGLNAFTGKASLVQFTYGWYTLHITGIRPNLKPGEALFSFTSYAITLPMLGASHLWLDRNTINEHEESYSETIIIAGLPGFEPGTTGLKVRCSTWLSYRPLVRCFRRPLIILFYSTLCP